MEIYLKNMTIQSNQIKSEISINDVNVYESIDKILHSFKTIECLIGRKCYHISGYIGNIKVMTQHFQ